LWSVCGEQKRKEKKKREHKRRRRGVPESGRELGKHLSHVDQCLDMGECLGLSADDSHRHERDGGVIRGHLPPHTMALGRVATKVIVVVIVRELMFVWCTCIGVQIFLNEDRSRKGVGMVNMGMSWTEVAIVVIIIVRELMFIWCTCVGVQIFLNEDRSGKGMAKVSVGVPKTEVGP
jgi:hypothetical protein